MCLNNPSKYFYLFPGCYSSSVVLILYIIIYYGNLSWIINYRLTTDFFFYLLFNILEQGKDTEERRNYLSNGFWNLKRIKGQYFVQLIKFWFKYVDQSSKLIYNKIPYLTINKYLTSTIKLFSFFFFFKGSQLSTKIIVKLSPFPWYW